MTLSSRTSAATALLLGLALASCGSSDGNGSGQGASDSELLEGTISDDMLPYDTVRSQPPLAAPEPTDGVAAKGDGTKKAAASEEAASDAQGDRSAAADPDAVQEERPAPTPPASPPEE